MCACVWDMIKFTYTHVCLSLNVCVSVFVGGIECVCVCANVGFSPALPELNERLINPDSTPTSGLNQVFLSKLFRMYYYVRCEIKHISLCGLHLRL